ncbi:MAG TPA: hypothetical protein VD886_19720, partial [Herpetosiphonaceae bacterium]|nr:hypothetical protein [Herpetosiphonaceae bacterium]
MVRISEQPCQGAIDRGDLVAFKLGAQLEQTYEPIQDRGPLRDHTERELGVKPGKERNEAVQRLLALLWIVKRPENIERLPQLRDIKARSQGWQDLGAQTGVAGAGQVEYLPDAIGWQPRGEPPDGGLAGALLA